MRKDGSVEGALYSHSLKRLRVGHQLRHNDCLNLCSRRVGTFRRVWRSCNLEPLQEACVVRPRANTCCVSCGSAGGRTRASTADTAGVCAGLRTCAFCSARVPIGGACRCSAVCQRGKAQQAAWLGRRGRSGNSNHPCRESRGVWACRWRYVSRLCQQPCRRLLRRCHKSFQLRPIPALLRSFGIW